jgi:uncharacterized lipoprotein YajG
MITTQDLVSAYIESKHGTAVSEQFNDTFNDSGEFEKQNSNALKLIQSEVNDIVKSEVFDDVFDLEYYSESLNEYLS